MRFLGCTLVVNNYNSEIRIRKNNHKLLLEKQDFRVVFYGCCRCLKSGQVYAFLLHFCVNKTHLIPLAVAVVVVAVDK